ncbi:MAG TPA: formate hydrogenase [Leptospiraceae bacterium]|nr:formate hydrogenase [Leptospiraceae bacterium]HNN04542.1 formate hydrogenase [Leptospiraceae bacterium]
MQSYIHLIYLVLLLTGVMILIENRLKRIIYLIGFQGFLLIFPVFQLHENDLFHTLLLSGMILVFKTALTMSVLLWTMKRSDLSEHTSPRFGYIATLLFFFGGLAVTIKIVEGMTELPPNVDKLEVIYSFLLVYMGILSFIARTHWAVLMIGFTMFENGIFLLALLLRHGLPFGVEFGAFVDTLLIIITGIALQFRSSQLQSLKGENQ